MQELLRGPEPESTPIEVLIFMGVGPTASMGRMALEDYRRLVDNERNAPEVALQKVLDGKSYLSGPIADLKDQL